MIQDERAVDLISTQVEADNPHDDYVFPAQYPFPPLRGARVTRCVEINQCVGCTRQFFTKSFLDDGVAALAPSSGEEPASPRHRAGVASMAWRSTR